MSLEICSADFQDRTATTGRSDRELLEYFRDQMAQLAGRFERMTWRQRKNIESVNLLLAAEGEPEFKEFCKQAHQGVFPPHRQLEAIKVLLADRKITDRALRDKIIDPPSIATIGAWRRRLDTAFPDLNCLSAGAKRRYNSDGSIRA